MIVGLTVAKYKGYFLPFGILSMAIFRIYSWIKRDKPELFKLMGTGQNGTFDIHPDWSQWVVLSSFKTQNDFESYNSNSFISKYIKKFSFESYSILLNPIKSHGEWDGKKPFENQAIKNPDSKLIGVLTRATIRLSKLQQFWKNVPDVAKDLNQAEGFLYSIGIGEIPFIKQATFSIWESEEKMINYAYKRTDHKNVIQKTKKNDWYSEELFARFEIISLIGISPNQLFKN